MSCDLFEPFPVPDDEVWQSWPPNVRQWVLEYNAVGEDQCGWVAPNPEPELQ